MSRRAVASDEANTRSVAKTAGLMPCMASFVVTRLRVRAQGALLPQSGPDLADRAIDKRPRSGPSFFLRLQPK
jgi:hypothetical protein